MERPPQHTDTFEAVFAYADIGIAVLARDGRVMRANDALARFLMRDAEELVGAPLLEMGGSALTDEEHFLSVVSGERDTFRKETSFIRADGTRVYALMTYAGIRGDRGAEAIVVVIDDITLEKEALMREREREQAVRRAYADVVSAMTGGRLLIVSEEELSDQLGELVLGPIEFHDRSGPGEARHAVRDYAKANAPTGWKDGFEVAIGEALINALKHAGGGEISLYTYGTVLQAVITDHGDGIDFASIARATFESGYSTAHTLGVGFTLILSFTSRILLSTGPEGTTIVLEGHDGGPDNTLPS